MALSDPWSGTITPATAEAIAERIRNLLTNKTYTWVECYEYAGWRPRIRHGQTLKSGWPGTSDPVRVQTDPCGVMVCDSYGSWSIRPKTIYANISSPPLVCFEDKSLLVRFTTPEQKGAWWLITVEP